MAGVILNSLLRRLDVLELDDEKVAKCLVVFVVVKMETLHSSEIALAIVYQVIGRFLRFDLN